MFTRKNELNIREDILRGVYEENRLMLGRGCPGLSLRRPFPLKKILLSAVVFLIAFLMRSQYIGTSFSPAELPANMSTDPFPLPAARVSEELPPDTRSHSEHFRVQCL
jgi:hypothetical protein